MTSTKLSITLDEMIKDKIKTIASSQGLSVNGYVMSLIIKDMKKNGYPDIDKKQIDYFKDIKKQLSIFPSGIDFTIESLFGKQNWNQINADERRALGKDFAQKVANGQLSGVIKIGKDSSNKTWYRK